VRHAKVVYSSLSVFDIPLQRFFAARSWAPIAAGKAIVAYENTGGMGRPMVQGNWTCSECGTAITELPFEPAQDRPIYCRDCWRNKRPPRRDFRR